MKKFAVFFIILMLLGTSVAAETTESNPGLLPGHPLYGVKLFVENFKLLLTRNTEARADLLAHYAEMRAQEIALLQDAEVSEKVLARAIERQEEILNKLQDLLENDRISDSAADKIMSTQAKVMSTLVKNLDKIPEKAQEALTLNILRRGEKILAFAEEKSDKFGNEAKEKLSAAVMTALEEIPAQTQKALELQQKVMSKLEAHLANNKSKTADVLKQGWAQMQQKLEQIKVKNKGN